MTDLEYAKALRKCAMDGEACMGCPRLEYCSTRIQSTPDYKPVTELMIEVADRLERTYQKKVERNCLS